MAGLQTAEIIRKYEAFLEQDPSDAMMKFWLAMTYLVENRDDDAQGLLEVVLGTYPGNDALLKVASDTYVWRKSHDKTADYERALTYLRLMRDAHIAHLGDADDEQLGLDDYDWLYFGTPFSFLMGEIYFLQSKLDEALQAYLRSLVLKPDHYKSFYRLGQVYDLLGDEDKAIANSEKYIGVTELNWYDSSATGREEGCAASRVCHSISRPVAVDDARRRIARLQ
jgi:tetratricopeptide (TPR) repeat protein